jgi:hypothetical protein
VEITRAFILTAVAATVTACSTSAWEVAALPPVDSSVLDLLPEGSYTFTGGLTLSTGSRVTETEGFVDFGTAADGAECEADYTISNTKAGATDLVKKVRVVRTSGRPSFFQNVTDDSQPGEWGDIADPSSPGIPLLFVPAIIASEMGRGAADNAGTGDLCSIGVMPRFMTTRDDGVLVFDTERTATVIEAAIGMWVASFVDALSLEGRKRDETIEQLLEVSTPSFELLIQDSVVTILEDDKGGFTISQLKKGQPMVELVFTPAAERAITPIDAPNYFEKVAKDVQANGLEKVLSDLGM